MLIVCSAYDQIVRHRNQWHKKVANFDLRSCSKWLVSYSSKRKHGDGPWTYRESILLPTPLIYLDCNHVWLQSSQQIDSDGHWLMKLWKKYSKEIEEESYVSI